MAFSVGSVGTLISTSGSVGDILQVPVPIGGLPVGAIIVLLACERTFTGSPLAAIGDSQGNQYANFTGPSLNNTNSSGIMIVGYSDPLTIAMTPLDFITYKRLTTNDDIAISVVYVTGGRNVTVVDHSSTFGSSTTPSVSLTPGETGELFLGALASHGDSGTFAQDVSPDVFATPPIEARSSTGSNGARINGGFFASADALARTYNPTISGGGPWAMYLFGFRPIYSLTTTALSPAAALAKERADIAARLSRLGQLRADAAVRAEHRSKLLSNQAPRLSPVGRELLGIAAQLSRVGRETSTILGYATHGAREIATQADILARTAKESFSPGLLLSRSARETTSPRLPAALLAKALASGAALLSRFGAERQSLVVPALHLAAEVASDVVQTGYFYRVARSEPDPAAVLARSAVLDPLLVSRGGNVSVPTGIRVSRSGNLDVRAPTPVASLAKARRDGPLPVSRLAKEQGDDRIAVSAPGGSLGDVVGLPLSRTASEVAVRGPLNAGYFVRNGGAVALVAAYLSRAAGRPPMPVAVLSSTGDPTRFVISYDGTNATDMSDTILEISRVGYILRDEVTAFAYDSAETADTEVQVEILVQVGRGGAPSRDILTEADDELIAEDGDLLVTEGDDNQVITFVIATTSNLQADVPSCIVWDMRLTSDDETLPVAFYSRAAGSPTLPAAWLTGVGASLPMREAFLGGASEMLLISTARLSMESADQAAAVATESRLVEEQTEALATLTSSRGRVALPASYTAREAAIVLAYVDWSRALHSDLVALASRMAAEYGQEDVPLAYLGTAALRADQTLPIVYLAKETAVVVEHTAHDAGAAASDPAPLGLVSVVEGAPLLPVDSLAGAVGLAQDPIATTADATGQSRAQIERLAELVADEKMDTAIFVGLFAIADWGFPISWGSELTLSLAVLPVATEALMGADFTDFEVAHAAIVGNPWIIPFSVDLSSYENSFGELYSSLVDGLNTLNSL